jgi:hypothetical protein
MEPAEMDTGHMIIWLCSLKIVLTALLHCTQNMILSGFLTTVVAITEASQMVYQWVTREQIGVQAK